MDAADRVVARTAEVRGARRARAWKAGNRRFLVAVRTLRLIVDIVVTWKRKRGEGRNTLELDENEEEPRDLHLAF